MAVVSVCEDMTDGIHGRDMRGRIMSMDTGTICCTGVVQHRMCVCG